MKVHLLSVALLATLLSCSIAAPTCIGYKEFADLNTDCRSRTEETQCLQGYAFRSANLTVSCVWHIMTETNIIDRQIVYNRHGFLSIAGVDYAGTVCSTAVRALLPTSSNKRWGTYMRMISGPQNISAADLGMFPRDSFVTSTCTAGQGASDSCKMQNTAPEGFALAPAFKSNSVLMDFSTTDKALIAEFNKTSRLSYPSTLKFKLEVEGTRCTNPKKYPKETPAISDRVVFGPSVYNLNSQFAPYFLRTFKAYRVTNVTGMDWSVNVTKSMVESGKKTKMTSFLMRESDYLKWAATECTTNCTPPVDMALPNTLCKGVFCKGKIRGLGAASGAYRLLVSYPEIAAIEWNQTTSYTGPVNIWPKYKKQMIKVEVWPRMWALGEPPLQANSESSSSTREEEAAALGPAPESSEAPASAPSKGKTPVPAPVPVPAPAPAPGMTAEEIVNPAAAALVPEPIVAVETPNIGSSAVFEEVPAASTTTNTGSAGVARSYMPEYDTPMFKPSFDI